MSAEATARISQWSRWSILLAAIIAGAGGVLSAWSSHARARETFWLLARGQGETLLEALNRAAPGLENTPPEERDAAFASLWSQGLRYAAVRGRVPFELGIPLGGRLDAPLPAPGSAPNITLDTVGVRIRMVFSPPPDPRRSRPAPRYDFERPPPPPPPPPGVAPRPPMIVEFEPVLAHQLQREAQRELGISALTAALLFAGGLVAFRWLRRRELLEREQERQRHLATLGEMSAVLAHEIRNPLTSLKGHAQLLAESLGQGKAKDKADRVVQEAIRLEALLTGLLAFVRTGAIHRRPVDPVSLARAAAEEVDAARVELDAGLAPERWQVDPDRLQQVLTNLLRNAIQASPNGAPVSVRVATDRGRLLYEVRDRGHGIEPGTEAALFEPFYTRRIHGTGLGLAVARRIVELHGGSIGASNHPGGGALFRITLPVPA